MIDFFRAVLGGIEDTGLWGEIRTIGDFVVPMFFSSLERMQSYAVTEDSQGRDVYFGVQPRTRAEGTADATRPYGDVLWLDLDGKSYSTGKMGAFRALAGVSPEPQIVVDSGHGYHAYWLLDDLYPFPQLQFAMKGLEKFTGADHCSDAARILRVPGTHNHKGGGKIPVRLLRFDVMRPYRHRLSDFADYIDLLAPTLPRRGPEEDVDGWEMSSEKAPKFPEGTRNTSLARLAGIMVARGMGYDEILVALGHENQMRCDPPLPDREVVAIARSVQRYR